MVYLTFYINFILKIAEFTCKLSDACFTRHINPIPLLANNARLTARLARLCATPLGMFYGLVNIMKVIVYVKTQGCVFLFNLPSLNIQSVSLAYGFNIFNALLQKFKPSIAAFKTEHGEWLAWILT